MVGATFCLGFEVFDIERIIEGWKNGVEGFRRPPFAQEEHIQAASLRATPENRRGKLRIVFAALVKKLG